MLPLLCTVAILAAALGVYFVWIRPLRRLRAAIAAVAAGERSAAEVAALDPESGGQLRRLNERLQRMEDQASEEIVNLQAVLGSLSEGVLIIDREETIRLANAGAERLLGLTNSPLNRPLLDVMRHHSVREAAQQTLQKGESHSLAIVLTIREAGGQYREKHLQISTAPLAARTDDAPVGVIAVLHDVTQLKRLENVRREFVVNISHELRTPLSIINGYLETLLEPDAACDADTAHRFHEVMWKHAERLRIILDDLLTLARLEAPDAAQVLHFAPLSLPEKLRAVVDRLTPTSSGRHVKIRLELSPEITVIDGDADRLDQVFFNLLDNALKHAVPPRSGNGKSARALEIVVRGELSPGDKGPIVELAFSDNGVGVPLADQPHLFERFYRVHKERNRESGGSGLGLSIARHIMRAHGGDLTVESAPGSGATFHVRLPAQRAVAPAATPIN